MASNGLGNGAVRLQQHVDDLARVPGPGGINLRTTLTSQFGGVTSLSRCVGLSEFALPASFSIEVSSLRSFTGAPLKEKYPGTRIMYVPSESTTCTRLERTSRSPVD